MSELPRFLRLIIPFLVLVVLFAIAAVVVVFSGHEARSRNLIQCGDNVRQGVNFICHCCGCCCEPLIAVRRLGVTHPVYTTNFLPSIVPENCTGCGKCTDSCPVEAIALVSANDFKNPARRLVRLNEARCLGCGVCIRVCSRTAIRLVAREQRILTPVNTAHRVVLMAIERGKLPQLIFDNRSQYSHRAMAAILGVIVKLPPVKQILASRQLKSRYLERLLGGLEMSSLSRTS